MARLLSLSRALGLGLRLLPGAWCACRPGGGQRVARDGGAELDRLLAEFRRIRPPGPDTEAEADVIKMAMQGT